MSYTKNTWANGDVITAAKLNNMEDGIAGAGGGYDAVVVRSVDEEEQPIITVESGSFSDFYSKYEDGDHPSVQIIYDDPDGGYGYYSVDNIFDDGDGGLLINVHSTSVAGGSTEAVFFGLQFAWTSSGIEVVV